MKRSIWLLLLILLMGLAGCGGGGETAGGETAVTEAESTDTDVVTREPETAGTEVSDTPDKETAVPESTEAAEEEAMETAVAEADEPTVEILTTLTLTDVLLDPDYIFPPEALPIAECTELLVREGTLTLYADGTLDFMPANPEALSDCFEFQEPFPLKGKHEIGAQGGDAILQFDFDEWLTVLQEGSPIDVIISGFIFERVGENLHFGRVDFFVSSNGDSGFLLAGYEGDEAYLLELAAVFAANEGESEGEETAAATVEPTPVFETTLPSVDAAAVSGDFTITGSANMVIVDELMVRFVDAGYAGSPRLNLSNGTAVGIVSLCLGDADGALATRTMTEDEAALCTSSGEQVLNFVLGRNPIVVIVNPANDWATEMSADELALALTTAETWSDVNGSWPTVPIDRFFPGSDSFPFGQVSRFLFPEDENALANAAGAQLSEDDNVLINGVANSEGAISFVSHSGFVEAQGVTSVSIGGLTPGSDGYLFDQPIILLTLDRVLQANPDMATFVNFALTDGRLALFDLGLALPDESTQQANEQAWLEAVGE